MSGIGLDEGDDELARVRHQVRAMELTLRTLEERLRVEERKASMALGLAQAAAQGRDAALRLRDASALEHERERTRRQAGDVLLEEAGDFIFGHCSLGDDEPKAVEILTRMRAHLTRQGETT